MKQYFVYLRKSTDESDRQILSISAQLSIVQDFTSRHNLQVKEIFKEAQSAMKPGRLIFNEMVKRLEKGEADGIIAHKTDRLSRNDVDSAKIFELMNRGFEIIFVDTPVLNNAIGRATLGMQLVWAKYYSENLSEEVKKGMNEKLSQGGWPNYAPLGYLNDKGAVIPDEERSPFIQKAFEEYANGNESIRGLVRKLYAAGLRSKKGKRVSSSHLQRVFDNPFYYGLMRWKGKLVQGRHQPLITRSLWEQVQTLRGRKNHPHPVQHLFAYRGFLKCGECGCSITAQITKGHTYYRCVKAKHSKCKQPYIREEDLTKALSEAIKTISIDRATLGVLKKELRLARDSIDSYRGQILASLKQQQSKLESKKQNLWDMRINNEIPKEIFDQKLAEIVQEGSQIADSLKSHESADNKWYGTCSNFLELAFSSYKLFKTGSSEEKRKILGSVCSNVVLKDRKLVKITYKPPFDVLCKKHLCPAWRPIICVVPTFNLIRKLKISKITKYLIVFFIIYIIKFGHPYSSGKNRVIIGLDRVKSGQN